MSKGIGATLVTVEGIATGLVAVTAYEMAKPRIGDFSIIELSPNGVLVSGRSRWIEALVLAAGFACGMWILNERLLVGRLGASSKWPWIAAALALGAVGFAVFLGAFEVHFDFDLGRNGR